MGILTEKRIIKWDEILATYGEETKLALSKLLVESEVDESDPAAIVIAGLFLALRDTNLAITSLSAVIDSGKSDLTQAFQGHLEQLRGIIAIAQEQLVKEGATSIKDRQEKLYEAVKGGVAKAVLESDRRVGNRTATFYLLCVLGTFAISVASVGFGAFGVRLLHPNSVPLAPEGSISKDMIDIVMNNQKQLNTCISNKIELDRKCVINIP